MRTIKFRGKRIDGKGLAYGDLLTGCGYKKGRYFILPHLDFYPSDCSSLDGYEIIPNTIGQFTGLIDKNDKEIYEGDILIWGENEYKSKPIIVCFKHGSFGYIYCDRFHSFAGNSNFTFNPLNTDVSFEIVGNIHDNPELLKGKNKKQ